MESIKLNNDGSMARKTFSGENYTGEYPSPKIGEETYRQFYDRCEKCRIYGFHLGDLSWSDYNSYCLGYPGNEECMGGDIIE